MNWNQRCFAGLFIAVLSSTSFAQTDHSKDTQQMQKDVYFLASDSLQVRDPGTEGDLIAMEFIKKRFQKISLKPLFKKFKQGFLVSF